MCFVLFGVKDTLDSLIPINWIHTEERGGIIRMNDRTHLIAYIIADICL